MVSNVDNQNQIIKNNTLEYLNGIRLETFKKIESILFDRLIDENYMYFPKGVIGRGTQGKVIEMCSAQTSACDRVLKYSLYDIDEDVLSEGKIATRDGELGIGPGVYHYNTIDLTYLKSGKRYGKAVFLFMDKVDGTRLDHIPYDSNVTAEYANKALDRYYDLLVNASIDQRDLKAANVMVNQNTGKVFIVDYGIAQFLENPTKQEIKELLDRSANRLFGSLVGKYGENTEITQAHTNLGDFKTKITESLNRKLDHFSELLQQNTNVLRK